MGEKTTLRPHKLATREADPGNELQGEVQQAETSSPEVKGHSKQQEIASALAFLIRPGNKGSDDYTDIPRMNAG